jgi:hypothetical protein
MKTTMEMFVRERIAALEAEVAELRKDAERIKNVVEGVKHRAKLRGFMMPEDAHDLLAAMKEAQS